MTDDTDASNGRHRSRRKPKLGDSRAPVTTLVVLAVAAIAVIAGFAVLRSVTDPGTGSEAATGDVATTVSTTPASTTSSTTPAPTTSALPSTTTAPTTTVAPTVPKSAATVVVANASGIDHSATAMTDELTADGYTTVSVANGTGPWLERSIIYYLRGDAASLGVARRLAEEIPTAQTLPMPDPPPLDRPLDGATVALMLGTDAAGRSLAELATG